MVSSLHGWMRSFCRGLEKLKSWLTQPCLHFDFGLEGNVMAFFNVKSLLIAYHTNFFNGSWLSRRVRFDI